MSSHMKKEKKIPDPRQQADGLWQRHKQAPPDPLRSYCHDVSSRNRKSEEYDVSRRRTGQLEGPVSPHLR